MFCKKDVLKNFVKVTVENPCRTLTQVLFCQFCKIFKNTVFTEHLWRLLFPILKLLDSPEPVMQINFWITHDLAHLNTLSSSWYFCVYLRQAQAFRFIRTASLKLYILSFFWQRRIEISWYLDQSIFFCANLYRNKHRTTSILLSLRSIGLTKVDNNFLNLSLDQVVNMSRDCFGGVPSS